MNVIKNLFNGIKFLAAVTGAVLLVLWVASFGKALL